MKQWFQANAAPENHRQCGPLSPGTPVEAVGRRVELSKSPPGVGGVCRKAPGTTSWSGHSCFRIISTLGW